ncbi:Protein containing two CBS domains (some fused to C-terminal double-stranded RNA-binding domain of RaiA family) [Halanaeroarchaeum sp. HSR-CO]|uniref:CBS domain-containing protein n=1 Tax=Halanaeroarchaeum sp. HSR-CO TaxID=2866382 RepID=UPI00217CCDFC|nr:CBS domain-containing protein [Halanaeroarchaeum sp. HSR-CO]UWG48603.1 Protein containing two CBS domains (some fused to C-terminal double-stranded RNA-binding domain of RaiA family) [Halanaeroarchaeum sp. HSR-CO]
MDIADIAATDFVEVDAGQRLGKVRAVFEAENPKGIIVTDDGSYAGVITERQLLQSHVEDDAKASSLTNPAPKVDQHEDIRETARMLVEGNTKVAPVFDGEVLHGIITEDDILDAVLENLDALDVADIYSENPITISKGDTVGVVINRLREHGISRLPVVDERGLLTGVVTIHDVVDVVIRDMDKATTGDRAGEIDRILDIPVADVLTSPVETVTLEDSVQEAVEEMLENDFSGLIVTDAGNDRSVIGVVTKTDVLRALTFTEEERMDVQITNIDLLDAITRTEIREDIAAIADKYSEMQVHHAHVRFHQHKEKLRGTPLIQSQIRLRTNKGQAAGSGEGYGADNAFYVALDKLERNVLEMKGIQADAEYEGQLLRKLNEL